MTYHLQKSWIKLQFGGHQSKKAIEIILSSDNIATIQKKEKLAVLSANRWQSW